MERKGELARRFHHASKDEEEEGAGGGDRIAFVVVVTTIATPSGMCGSQKPTKGGVVATFLA